MENKMQITDIQEGDYVDVTMRLKMVNGVLIDYLKRGYSLPKAGVKCVVAIEKSKDAQILQAIDLLQTNGFSVSNPAPTNSVKPIEPWGRDKSLDDKFYGDGSFLKSETSLKFKVGDMVRVIKLVPPYYQTGDIGKVIEINADNLLNIEFGNGTWWCWPDCVEPLPNDWIDWHGGECPVDGDVKVEVELRSGHIETRKAKKWAWEHSKFLPGGDIIKYRII